MNGKQSWPFWETNRLTEFLIKKIARQIPGYDFETFSDHHSSAVVLHNYNLDTVESEQILKVVGLCKWEEKEVTDFNGRLRKEKKKIEI